MKNRIISFSFSIVCAVLVLTLCVSAASDNSYNWYCPRNKEHKQPRLDTNMSFIEEYNGYYVDKKHGDDCGEKVVYLTFDAGYENGNVEKILDILKEEDVKGAFFILGNLIKRAPELVNRMADEGHTVANHTNSHRDMTSFENIDELKAELESLETLYKDTTGKEMSRYFRPPEGRFNKKTMEYIYQLGYKTVFWSLAYADWDNNDQPTENFAKGKIFDNMHNGAVILLHPTSDTNAKILSEVIRTLKAEGYRFGTLDELTAVDGSV